MWFGLAWLQKVFFLADIVRECVSKTSVAGKIFGRQNNFFGPHATCRAQTDKSGFFSGTRRVFFCSPRVGADAQMYRGDGNWARCCAKLGRARALVVGKARRQQMWEETDLRGCHARNVLCGQRSCRHGTTTSRFGGLALSLLLLYDFVFVALTIIIVRVTVAVGLALQ